ncbi:MAG: hypothetical protein R2783_05430 [Gelidibacter sp.]
MKHHFWALYFEEFYRYGFILVFYPVLHYTFHGLGHSGFLRVFYGALKLFMCINLIAILVGMAFGVQVFRTYEFGRFGYNGFLLSQGLTPYVYLTATIIFWSRNDYRMLAVTLLISALSGVKGVYFGEFLLFLFFVFYNDKFSKAHKMKLALGLCCRVLYGNPDYLLSTPTLGSH